MEHRLVNGISVHVHQMGPPGAPLVMMANSLAADMTMWAAQADALAQKYRVIRFDTRGHGQTDATGGDYSLDLLVDDVLSLLDSLGVERVHFIGLSLGGMIGQLLAVRAPDRLSSLILCATFASASPEMWDQRVRAARASGIEPMVEATLERWLTPSFRATHPEVADAVREMVSKTTVEGYAGCAAAIRDMNLSGVAEQISVPTLLVAAADDPSATPEMMSQLHQRIDGARFALLENAAHLFTVERPDQASQIMREFLDGLCDGMELRTSGPERTVRQETR